ncbi:MCE family protein [Spongisporangium articulatum]|uniref:MCE family protein n=1 Tax=Spongisporangium articulatum TaxID=3362603 RepID=A0ABW8AVR4_9ACTN
MRERDHLRLGVVGSVAVLVLLAVALNSSTIISRFGTDQLQAVFGEAGGLAPGDEVRMAGTTVGSVTGVRLEGATVLVTMRVDDDLPLRNRSRAAIKTATVLGRKYVALSSEGSAPLRSGARIPRDRTTSPYDITRTLADLTTNVRDIDTGKVADALDTGTDVFARTPESFAAALDGIRRLSDTIASRDEQLTTLLQRTQNLTQVLAERRDALIALVDDGNTLLRTVLQQRQAVENLFTDLSSAVDQLQLLVQEGRTRLHPALKQLSKTLALVNKRRADLDLSLQRLGPFIRSLGEAVGNGPFFLAYVGNLTPAGFPQTAGNP